MICLSTIRLEQLVSEHASGENKSNQGTETFQSLARFIASSEQENDSSGARHKTRDLPVWLVSHFLIFYATFIAYGCPCAVVISAEARLSIISQLETGKLHKLKSNIFDDCADEVLTSLYDSWFPRFIAHRNGEELPSLDPAVIPIPYVSMTRNLSTVSIESNHSSSSHNMSKGVLFRKRSMASFNVDHRKNGDIIYSKDSFVRVLYDQENYNDFQTFVDADHCKENLQFFESYSKLERLLCENIPLFKNLRVSLKISNI